MPSFRFRFASFLEDWAWAVKEKENNKENRKFLERYGLTDLPRQERKVTRYNFYGGVNVLMLDALLASGEIKPGEHILAVGCGTGIFLFYLASKGFSYLVGQELDADIFAVAKKNAGAFRTKVPDYAGHLEIRNENAVTAGVPDDIRICYLFNSFYDQNTYTEWIEALRESVKRTPRKVKVLLLYPTPSSLSAFRQCGWLKETRSIESRSENLPQFVRFQVFEN